MGKMMTDDMGLLREYTEGHSEEAFATLVSRHVNLVYSVALRQTRDPHLAEEITQAVFIILAQKAQSLPTKAILAGWLCRTARYVSSDAIKMQRRRQQREQEAYMQSVLDELKSGLPDQSVQEGEAWKQIAPLLDAALEQLGETDHSAVVLRFFEGRSMREVGAAMGASEEAAKKRVNRAVEKLQKFFLKRGVNSTAGIIAGALTANSIHAAPATLAKTTAAVALAKGSVVSGSTLALIKGGLKIMAWTKAKTAIVIGVVAILAAGSVTTLVVEHRHGSGSKNPPNRIGTNPGDFAPAKLSAMAHMKSIQMTVIPAFFQYAKDHDDDIPANMADLQPYLPPDTNGINYENWEILANGKLTPQLKQHDVVLIQQKDVPTGQYGNVKMIGYMDGHFTFKR